MKLNMAGMILWFVLIMRYQKNKEVFEVMHTNKYIYTHA